MKCTKKNLLDVLHACAAAHLDLYEMYQYNNDEVNAAREAGKAMTFNDVVLMLEENDFFDKMYHLWVEEDC